MSSGLSLMPDDVLILIAAALVDVKDLLSFRLACKSLYHKTKQHFSHRCLATIDTDLSRQHLRRLTHLAADKELAPGVRALRINHTPAILGQGFVWERHPDGYLANPASNEAGEVLAALLTTDLINCRSFHVEGRRADEDDYELDDITPTDAINFLLAIIAKTRIRPKAFSIELRKNGTGRMDGKRLNLQQQQQYQTPAFTQAWAKLETLRLELTLSRASFNNVLQLVTTATNLKVLWLNLDFCMCDEFVSSVIAAEGALQCLQEIHFKDLFVSEELLQGLLAACSSSRLGLRALTIQFVTLREGGSWQGIFNHLRSHAPRLGRIDLCYLKALVGGKLQGVVFHDFEEHFGRRNISPTSLEVVRKKRSGDDRIHGFSYHGSLGLNLLEAVIASAVTLR